VGCVSCSWCISQEFYGAERNLTYNWNHFLLNKMMVKHRTLGVLQNNPSSFDFAQLLNVELKHWGAKHPNVSISTYTHSLIFSMTLKTLPSPKQTPPGRDD
jgi:hypothetical protein